MNAKDAIDDLTHRFFNAFTTHESGELNISIIYDLFIPEGLIVKNVGPEPEIYNLKQFVEPRRVLLTSGQLVNFSEEEISEHTQIFGNIAQRFSRYRKSGTLAGTFFETEGMKTIQFIQTGHGWKMSALAWDDEPAP